MPFTYIFNYLHSYPLCSSRRRWKWYSLFSILSNITSGHRFRHYRLGLSFYSMIWSITSEMDEKSIQTWTFLLFYSVYNKNAKHLFFSESSPNCSQILKLAILKDDECALILGKRRIWDSGTLVSRWSWHCEINDFFYINQNCSVVMDRRKTEFADFWIHFSGFLKSNFVAIILNHTVEWTISQVE